MALFAEQPCREFGGCPEPYAEHSHLQPHASGKQPDGGSGREAQDLVHGCRLHHKLLDQLEDAGLIRLLRWTEDGRPVFFDDQGGDYQFPKPWPEERDDGPMPPWLLKALSRRLRRKYERLQKK